MFFFFFNCNKWIFTWFAQYIKELVNLTCLQRYEMHLDQWHLSLIWSFTVSIFCVGGLLGSVSAGQLVTRHGRLVLLTDSYDQWGGGVGWMRDSKLLAILRFKELLCSLTGGWTGRQNIVHCPVICKVCNSFLLLPGWTESCKLTNWHFRVCWSYPILWTMSFVPLFSLVKHQLDGVIICELCRFCQDGVNWERTQFQSWI